MSSNPEVRSKLDMAEKRVTIPVHEIVSLVSNILENMGCSAAIAREVAEHLADANLCGMESHGLMRTLQYADQFESGYMRADVEPAGNIEMNAPPFYVGYWLLLESRQTLECKYSRKCVVVGSGYG